MTEQVAQDNHRVNSSSPLGWALLITCALLIVGSFYLYGRFGPQQTASAGRRRLR